MKNLPVTSTELIEALDALYPPRCIGPDETPIEAHRYAGKRELIDGLKARLAATEKRALKDALTRT